MVTMTLIQGVVNTFVIFISVSGADCGWLYQAATVTKEKRATVTRDLFAIMVLELVFGILASASLPCGSLSSP